MNPALTLAMLAAALAVFSLELYRKFALLARLAR